MERDPSIWFYGLNLVEDYKAKDFVSSECHKGVEGHLDCYFVVSTVLLRGARTLVAW
jgi:hypothetical protein